MNNQVKTGAGGADYIRFSCCIAKKYGIALLDGMLLYCALLVVVWLLLPLITIAPVEAPWPVFGQRRIVWVLCHRVENGRKPCRLLPGLDMLPCGAVSILGCQKFNQVKTGAGGAVH